MYIYTYVYIDILSIVYACICVCVYCKYIYIYILCVKWDIATLKLRWMMLNCVDLHGSDGTKPECKMSPAYTTNMDDQCFNSNMSKMKATIFMTIYGWYKQSPNGRFSIEVTTVYQFSTAFFLVIVTEITAFCTARFCRSHLCWSIIEPSWFLAEALVSP